MSPDRPEKPAKAVALRYERDKDAAPRVVAKGRGYLAEAIQTIARENHVPLLEDPNLVEVLEALDLHLEVPPELYRAVAEVLVFVYRLNGKLRQP
jgi:flagellar biosynthesis protein